jgi:hypothetical protein
LKEHCCCRSPVVAGVLSDDPIVPGITTVPAVAGIPIVVASTAVANAAAIAVAAAACCIFAVAGISSLGRYVFGSEISYNKAPPRLPGLGC